jgi:1,4-alpha-glucan branching enzyme
LGLKYHRITGRDVPQNRKEPYIPAMARDKAAENAAHFISERIKQAHILRETFDGHPPLVVSPYDAELYGHWWFEGPQFIDFFFKKIHYDQTEIQCITPGDFLDSGLPIQVQKPTASSWGENGYYKVWINEGNSWMYPYQHDAERRMTELANRVESSRFKVQSADPETSSNFELAVRIANQAARELLLAQSSDWAFQIYQGTTVQYSSRRFESHIQRFNMLAEMLETGEVDHELLAEIEHRDNIFAEIDYRVYRN